MTRKSSQGLLYVQGAVAIMAVESTPTRGMGSIRHRANREPLTTATNQMKTREGTKVIYRLVQAVKLTS